MLSSFNVGYDKSSPRTCPEREGVFLGDALNSPSKHPKEERKEGTQPSRATHSES